MCIIRPMLAESATDEQVARLLKEKGTMWGSVKIDGVRCTNKGQWSDKEHRDVGLLVSRSQKRFPNMHLNEQFGGPEFSGWDGELTVTEPNDARACRSASAAVATIKGESPWRWYIFDCVKNLDQPYHERYARIPVFDPATGARKLPQTPISTMAEFHAFERKAVEKNGYEGVILRDPNARYKEGRSTIREGWMVKIKRFEDAEAEIIGFEEELANTNEATLDERGYTKRSNAKAGMIPKGTLGALICRDLKTGVEFSVGGGFSADERMLFWASRINLKGQIITYKHLPTGAKDKPRHTGFVAFRNHFDMDPIRAEIGLPADVRHLI